MTSLSQYYEESLYPLQDGVLSTISRSGTDFFLTGGTALSRAYYHHRYSDDLDFFINNDPEFDKQLDIVLDCLRADGFYWDSKNDFIRADNFSSLKVQWKKSNAGLKLDFVNDLVPHFGEIKSTPIFYRVDSVRNILSNKLSAIFRYANKDIADIREIALHESFDWAELIHEAREKEAGLEIPLICEILQAIPKYEFDSIKWVHEQDWRTFRNDIDKIVLDLITCEKSRPAGIKTTSVPEIAAAG